MKKLITIALATTLLTTVAIAESTAVERKKIVVCEDSNTLMKELITGDYEEKPAWGGTGEKSMFILLINKKTGTWTLIEGNKTIACVLGVGEDSRIFDLDKKKLSL